MNKITREQYEFALARVEELLPLVDDNTPANDKNAVELTMMSDVVIAYEKEHFPISKLSVAELIEFSLQEKGMTQRQLAGEIGISPSRVNDYITGRSEPTLKIARSRRPCWEFKGQDHPFLSFLFFTITFPSFFIHPP